MHQIVFCLGCPSLGFKFDFFTPTLPIKDAGINAACHDQTNEPNQKSFSKQPSLQKPQISSPIPSTTQSNQLHVFQYATAPPISLMQTNDASASAAISVATAHAADNLVTARIFLAQVLACLLNPPLNKNNGV